MSILRTTLTATLLAGLLVGCANTPGTHHRDVVVYGRHIAIDGAYPHRLPDGSTEVTVRGYSKHSWDRSARYRAQWWDQDRRPVPTVVDNWFPVTLQGNRPFEFTMVGPGPAAVVYKIEIEVLED